MDTNLQKYRSFIAVYDTGSFSEAAKKLSYSQSGISRMIADLENTWDIILFERNKTGAHITSDGLKLVPHVQKLLEDFDRIDMEIDEIHGVITGILRIGCFSSIATHLIPKLIREFRENFPGIEYEFVTGEYHEIEKWIASGRVDCGFTVLPTRDNYDYIDIENDKFMAILPKNHPLASQDSVSLTDLCNYPFMLLEKDEVSDVSKILNSAGLTPDVRFKTWDDYSIMSMVENGLGVSILPKLILNRIPYDVEIREIEGHPSRSICLAYRGDVASNATRKFVEFLKEKDL